MLSIQHIIQHSKIEKREAEMILARVLNVSRASVIAHPEREPSMEQAELATQMLHRRAQGEPMAYILGEREFYGGIFVVSRNVLIPRPETEILVEQALALVSGHFTSADPTLLDLGTGSGCVAVMLAKLCPNAKITATDISSRAIQIARGNAFKLNVDIEFIEGDWYSALQNKKFDLIVSNPPYIALGDAHLSLGDLRFEPRLALTDGDEKADGMAAINKIINGAPAHLNARGWLLLEHGYDQAERCVALMRQAGFTQITTAPDLAGIPRVTSGKWTVGSPEAFSPGPL